MKVYRDPRTGKVYDKISDALCDYCESVVDGQCTDCAFAGADTGCGRFAMMLPDEAALRMGLEIIDDSDGSTTAATDRPTDKDINVPGKPRLAEVLGVEVGEHFRVGDVGCDFWIEADGWPRSELFDRNTSSKWVVNAINQPESIIRAPRLTEAELAIMRDTGARWVSRDALDYGVQVSLWKERPGIVDEFFRGAEESKNCGWIGNIATDLFPSVHPGDCIALEDN